MVDVLKDTLLGQLPLNIVMLMVLAVLWVKVNELCKRFNELKTAFEKQVKWCLEHFQEKQ